MYIMINKKCLECNNILKRIAVQPLDPGLVDIKLPHVAGSIVYCERCKDETPHSVVYDLVQYRQ